MALGNSSDSWPVVLIKSVGIEDEFSFELEKKTSLPFIPSPSISLGLCSDSWFDQDVFVVKRVLYLTCSREFLVELEGIFLSEENSIDFMKWVKTHYLDIGWRLVLRLPCSTPEEPDSEGILYVIEARGSCYYVDEYELRVLDLCCESYRIVQKPGIPA